MDLNKLTDNVLKLSSSFTREQGKKLALDGFVKELKNKRIDETNHIYGRVLNDNKSKQYSTHIKIDVNTDRVLGSSCSCELFEENRREVRNYVCKHIVATSWAFYNVAKRKLQARQTIISKEVKKELKRFLKLDLIVKCIKNDGILSYQCEFRIGTDTTHLIMDLRDFVDSYNNKKSLEINQIFTFNPLRDEFLPGDKKVIDFLNKYKEKINKKYLIIHQGQVVEFFKLIDEEKKIIFNYDFINYETKIRKENIPVALTIRCDRDAFILKSQKKFPYLLNSTGEAMLFDRHIYLPRKKQVNSYVPLYKQLMKNSEIRYSKTLDTLSDLLADLKNVTHNIVLDENTIEFKNKLIKPNLYFYKDRGQLYCNVKINYCGYIIDLIKDATNTTFLRDRKKEALIDMELERFKFIKSEKDYKFIGEDEDVFTLLTAGFTRLKEIAAVEVSENFKDTKLINSSKITSELNEFDKFYKLNYNFEDFEVKELGEAISIMKSGGRFYRSKTRSSYLDLEDPGVVEFLNLLDDLGLDNLSGNEIEIDKNKMLYLQEKLKNRELSFIRGSEAINEVVTKLLDRDYKRKLVPKALNAKLRSYQIDGFKWLNEITSLGFGGILADDMGLGKTIQIIAFILSQKKTKTLIVTPTTVIYNWKDEFERFAPSIRVGLVHGSKQVREKLLSDIKKYDVLITTYGSLKNDEEIYNDISFDYCIIDEAQNIKNSKAQATLTVKKIKSKCNIALTGTPIENNLMELWSIFDFVMPGYLFEKERFRERFVALNNIEELKTLITPFILRRLKSDVLDELPSKVEKKYLVEMNTKQKQIYKSYLKEVKAKIDNSRNNVNLFAYLTKLRELCLDPSLVISDYQGESAKLKVALELVDELTGSGKKILLFSQFTSVLKKIEDEFKTQGVNYMYLDGGTSAKDRVESVKEFNDNEDIQVFLISLKAGGVGLNLTSASIVIHFDPWWNPAIEDQATDRAHRFGQKNMVEVIKLVAKDTIEEKIVLMQEDKKELIQSLIDGKSMDGSHTFKKLSDEEILELFN